MRPCIDEHYSPEIAEALRAPGHDVVGVAERVDHRGLDDGALLGMMQTEKRVLLTEDVSDFVPIVQEVAASGERHWGIAFSSPASFPRGSGRIGLFVDALDRLLRERSAEDAPRDRIWWLHTGE